MDGRRYRGVSKRGKKWCAEIRDSSSTFLKGRRWLGTHDTLEHAARAYDKEARKIWGPQAVTNFPGPSDQNQVNIDVPVMMPNADCESSCVLAKIMSERDSWLQSIESHPAGVAEVKGVRINCDPFDPPEFTILSPSFPTRVGQYTYNSVEVINNHPIFEVGEVRYVPVLDSLKDDSAEHPLFQVPVLDNLRDGSVEHPLFRVNISPVAISKLIELPILLWEYPPAEVRTCGCPDHQNMFPPWDNIPATYLRIHLDQTSPHFGYVRLCTTEVLAVRDDRKVLLPFHMEALCRFCQLKVVPLIEECRKSSGLVQRTIDSIMQSITKSSFQNFFHSYCAELMDNYPYWKAPLSPYEM